MQATKTDDKKAGKGKYQSNTDTKDQTRKTPRNKSGTRETHEDRGAGTGAQQTQACCEGENRQTNM